VHRAALHFVGAATFQGLTGHPVFTDLWDERVDNGMAHIDLSRGADAIVVAPASADFSPSWCRVAPMICCRRCVWRATARCWWRRR
jgi:phosphopantothenoylcysteine synthetase/decarboxylase